MSQVRLMTPSVFSAWSNFVGQRPFASIAEAALVADLFASEMRRYCEFIQGPGGQAIGLMFRGEGVSFTNRVGQQLRAWDMPMAGLAHHAALADMFEHKRAFLKLEWSRLQEMGPSEHLAAFYFRRRPPLKRILEQLLAGGVARDILEQVADVARLLGKDSAHFVAAALRPGHAVRHKLYFSQYITPATAEAVLQRLLEVMAQFEIDPATVDHWRQHHSALAPPTREPTIFVSVSFENDLLIPSLKIDYPEASLDSLAALLPFHAQAKTVTEVRQLCADVGVENLAYLGMRFHRSDPPGLKYYADFYPAEPA